MTDYPCMKHRSKLTEDDDDVHDEDANDGGVNDVKQ